MNPQSAGSLCVHSSNSPGVLVSGIHQQVGSIDGSGTTQVNTGSDLTANHIIQSSLVIGGTSGSPALVTIDASDASGNPLGQSSKSALADALTPDGPFGADGISSAILSSNIGADMTAPSVPEPSTLLLVLLALSSFGWPENRATARDLPVSNDRR
jgi:hypothetical protein